MPTHRVRHEEWWECDICRSRHESSEKAAVCEEQGRMQPLPRGLCFRFYPNSQDPFYSKAIFAIADRGGRPDGHYLDPGMWAARPGLNDNLVGSGLCGGNSWKLNSIYAPDKDSPHLRRMVASLYAHDIDVTIWDGCVVPFEEWMGQSVEDYLGIEKFDDSNVDWSAFTEEQRKEMETYTPKKNNHVPIEDLEPMLREDGPQRGD